jgi:hypothetical protein
MKARILHWVGGELKLPGFDIDPNAEAKEFDVTADDLLKFYAAGYDVMLRHPHHEALDCVPAAQTKAMGRKGRKALRGTPCQCPPKVVWLDDPRRGFCQR